MLDHQGFPAVSEAEARHIHVLQTDNGEGFHDGILSFGAIPDPDGRCPIGLVHKVVLLRRDLLHNNEFGLGGGHVHRSGCLKDNLIVGRYIELANGFLAVGEDSPALVFPGKVFQLPLLFHNILKIGSRKVFYGRIEFVPTARKEGEKGQGSQVNSSSHNLSFFLLS